MLFRHKHSTTQDHPTHGWSSSWPISHDGQRSLFLKIPLCLDLSKFGSNTSLLDSLPNEMINMVLSYLDPISRVCLSLSCRRICLITSSSNLLNLRHHFPWSETNVYNTCDFVKEEYEHMKWNYSRHLLLERLAPGWCNSNEWQYCTGCKRIRTRDKTFYWKRIGRIKPKYDRLWCPVTESEWERKSERARFGYIIDLWCESGLADNLRDQKSRPNNADTNISTKQTSKSHDQASAEQAADIEKGLRDFLHACPTCTERRLTVQIRKRHKPVYRPWLWRRARTLGGCLENTLLIFLYLIFLLLRAPYILGRWVWKAVKKKC